MKNKLHNNMNLLYIVATAYAAEPTMSIICSCCHTSYAGERLWCAQCDVGLCEDCIDESSLCAGCAKERGEKEAICCQLYASDEKIK